MKKLFIILLIVIATVLVVGTVYLFPRSPYWPQERIVIALPFSQDQPPKSIIPMGETVDHPNAPLGHPGIDFQWDYPAAVLASADGTVETIKSTKDDNGITNWAVEVRNGKYKLSYVELESYEQSLKKGAKVKTGDKIGIAYKPFPDKEHRNLHWELGYSFAIGEPLCPLTYFNSESKKRIEDLWNRLGPAYRDYKAFPDLCSGGFKNRDQ
jgi:murein DD-endopeptidase MepM/ murein hydrolase activator NlpD